MRALSILIPLLALAACGPDDGAPSPVPSATAPAAVQTPALTAIQRVTTIDVTQLPNYARPDLPAHYAGNTAAIDNTPATNPIDNRTATLGRVLFYDRQLSVNGAVSCASCHQQAVGFGDSARFSTGFSGQAFTTAHSMRLGNVRYWQPGTMFWDRRAATLEAQASQPIIHPVEMGWDSAAGGIAALIVRLQGLDYYRELFTLAYGDQTVSEDRIQRALAQFERAMISSDSRFDRAFAVNFRQQTPAADLPGFSAEENRGWQLFRLGPSAGGAGCGTCHTPPTFALDAASRSNGLDAGNTIDFKSPSLKNVGLAQAFMHDGRFSTLEQVVEHYNSGIQAGPALDARLRTPGGAPLRLNLSTSDKAALVAFLRTLTDETLLADPRFASPFRQ